MRPNNRTSNLMKAIIVVADFIVLNILFYSYLLIVGGDCGNGDYCCSTAMLMVIANIGMVGAQYFFSTIVHRRRSTSEQILRQSTMLVILYSVLTYVLMVVSDRYEGVDMPGLAFMVKFSVILYVGILLSRYVERWSIKHYRTMGRNRRTVVFVGSDPRIIDAYSFLAGSPYMGYHVLGYYADTELVQCPEGLTYRGSVGDFEEEVRRGSLPQVDEMYCCVPITAQEQIRKFMRYCRKNVAHFYYIPIYTQPFGHTVKFEYLGNTIVFTNYDEPLMNPTNRFVKRTFDVIFSALVIICLLPFIPIIAFIIKLQSPGPIFFRQLRTGLNGRDFMCYKFRSMHINKEADLVQATENDPRKFAFGDFMRKTNIDELPQFLNVLLGDMSIVGPRPHMLHHTEVYRQLIDKYMVRHFVKPGITGWAQVTGFRGETKELWQMEGRVQRDIWYIENWSVWLDLRIIGKTISQIFFRDEHAY